MATSPLPSPSVSVPLFRYVPTFIVHIPSQNQPCSCSHLGAFFCLFWPKVAHSRLKNWSLERLSAAGPDVTALVKRSMCEAVPTNRDQATREPARHNPNQGSKQELSKDMATMVKAKILLTCEDPKRKPSAP